LAISFETGNPVLMQQRPDRRNQMTDPMNPAPGSVPPAWSPAQPSDETQTTYSPPAGAPAYGAPAGVPASGAPVPPQYAQPGAVPPQYAQPGAVPPPAQPAFAQPETWATSRPVQAAPQPQPTWATPAVPPAQPWVTSPAPVAPAGGAARKSGGIGVTTLVAAMLGTAIIASGGTYVAISAANGGADQQPAAGVEQGQDQEGGNQQPSAQGQAPATPAPTSAPANDTPAVTSGDLTDVVKAVSPAVVTITAEGVTSTDIFGQASGGTAKGSGVIFDASGLVLTNRHVVSGNPSKLTVTLKDGRTVDAEIYGIDTMTDLAIVKVNEAGLPTARIGDSNSIEVGQQAIAIGSPLGEFTDSVTSGIVSALHRSIQVEDGSTISNLIQTDTAINPGNSGGPLLNIKGEVVGINTAVAGGSQGIGFAIPINIARPLLAQASAGQALARPWLGIRFEMITPDLKQQLGLTADSGAWIPDAQVLAGAQGVTGQGNDPFGGQGNDPFGQGQQIPTQADLEVIVAGSPAETAGLQAGDVITALNGAAIDSSNALDYALSQYGPGDTISLSVLRDGQTITVEVTLGTRPASL
jgi:serine protease Do